MLAVSLTLVHTSRYTTLRLAKLRAVTPTFQGISPVGILLLKELYLTFKAHTAHTRNWRFSASYDSFVVQKTLVLRMNICGENRQLLVATKR